MHPNEAPVVADLEADLKVIEVPTGTKAFDWTVPKEWSINDAWIADLNGNKLIDFKNNNLHVMGYSTPINTTLSLKELEKHGFKTEVYKG